MSRILNRAPGGRPSGPALRKENSPAPVPPPEGKTQQPAGSLLITVLFPLTATSSLLFPKFFWGKSKFAGVISQEDENPLVITGEHPAISPQAPESNGPECELGVPGRCPISELTSQPAAEDTGLPTGSET